MTPAVRVGIVGYGQQGGVYADLVAAGRVPGMVLGALSARSPDKREAAARAHPGVPFHADAVDLMESGDVDAVVVCVPPYEHPRVAGEALTRGLHVLVEKPAGVHTRRVRELNDLAASRPELTFAMMFNQRANPIGRRVKEIVDAGEIGAIRRSTWVVTSWWRPQAYFDSSPWRATWAGEGGGVLVNQAPHQLDLWQWICGVPTSVWSKVAYGFRRDIAVEDEVTAVVDHGDGVTGTFITGTHDLVGTDRLEILGDSGKVVVEGSRTATVTRFARPERELSESLGAADVERLLTGRPVEALAGFATTEVLEFDSVWGEQHAEVLANFAANILDGTPLLAPGSEGILGVRLANAIHLSSWTGEEVSLDFDEDAFLEGLAQRVAAEKASGTGGSARRRSLSDSVGVTRRYGRGNS